MKQVNILVGLCILLSIAGPASGMDFQMDQKTLKKRVKESQDQKMMTDYLFKKHNERVEERRVAQKQETVDSFSCPCDLCYYGSIIAGGTFFAGYWLYYVLTH